MGSRWYTIFAIKKQMTISKFTEKCVTYLSGKTLRMFRFDCIDSGVGKSQKLKQIIHWYYRNNPPLGFNKENK